MNPTEILLLITSINLTIVVILEIIKYRQK
jgi:hypothetical protein